MQNINGNKFIWGNYNYSNDLSNNLNNNTSLSELKQEENNKNFLTPITSKIKEGLKKIKTLDISNKINDNKDNKKLNLSNVDININRYEEEEDFQIKCLIDEYKDRVIGKDHVIFYKIELNSLLSGKKWEVYRNIQEFSDLYLIYQKLFLDVPCIKWPNTTNIRKEPILHRQLINQLNSFINNLLVKPGLLTSPFLIEFLELQNHHNDLTIYKPFLRYDSNSDDMYSNKLSINDVLFIEEPKLLLLGTGLMEGESLPNENDNNNTKFSLFNKIGKIFSSNKEEKSNICKGKFYIYNIIKNNNLELMLVEIKCIEVISEIIKLDFFTEKNIIILGLNNGQILIFELYIKSLNPNSSDILEYIGTINYHSNPPLCCLFNFKENYIYSFAKYETNIKICELNYQTLIKNFNIYNDTYKKSWKNKGIICVDYTISYEYIYIQDEECNIFFIDIISDVLNPYIVCYFPKFLKNSKVESKSKIIRIKNSFYLFISETIKSKVILNIYLILINEYNIDNNEAINLIKMKEINLNGDFNITNIRISNYYDIIISLSNGALCIYNHSTKNPEYYFIYHHKSLSNFIWYEKQKSIISVSIDKSIKIFQIPLKWPAEIIRKNKEINNINIIEDMNKDTKNIFLELESAKNKKYNENINEENNEENINNENIHDKEIIYINSIWDIGNIKQDKLDLIKSENDKVNNEEIIYSQKIEEINRIHENNCHLEKYDKYYYYFSDDLDGWSN